MNEQEEMPVLFYEQEVCATLDGRKTQFRRVIKNADGAFWDHAGWYPTVDPKCIVWRTHDRSHEASMPVRCPYGQNGTRLWVKETWCPGRGLAVVASPDILMAPAGAALAPGIIYRADGYQIPAGCHWRSSTHMPRWASRIQIKVTYVTVQRIQSISEEDAEEEGFGGYHTRGAEKKGPSGGILQTRRIATMWDLMNRKKAPWEKNPWVWAISFQVLRIEKARSR